MTTIVALVLAATGLSLLVGLVVAACELRDYLHRRQVEARLRKLADDFGPATRTDIDAALALAAHTNVGIERLASVAPVIPLRGDR